MDSKMVLILLIDNHGNDIPSNNLYKLENGQLKKLLTIDLRRLPYLLNPSTKKEIR